MRCVAGGPTRVTLAALVFLLLAPSAMAAEDTLVARLPLDLTGDVRADAQNATALIAADPAGRRPLLDLEFVAAEALVSVTNFTTHEQVDCRGPVGGLLCRSDGDETPATIGNVRNAQFLLHGLRPDFAMVFWNGAQAGANYTVHPLERPRLDVTVAERQASYTDEPVGLDFNRPIPPDTILVTDTALRYEIRGDFTFMVHGADLTVVTPEQVYPYETGTWVQRTDPQGVHVTTQRTTQYVKVLVTDAVLTLRAAGGAQELFAPVGEIVVDVDGGIRTLGAAGTLQIGDQSVRSSGERVTAEGSFRLTPTYVVPGSNKQVVFAVSGTIETLAVGQRTYFGDDAAVVAVAATSLTVLLAGLGTYFWPTVKGGLLVPLYAKLTKNKVLDQETRALVHAKVEQDPGCQAKQVAEALNISWTTAAYHLRVLTKMGLIVAKRQGRHEHYFVNGSRAAAGHEIVTALHNETTRRILEAVLRSPGIIQKDLCDQLALAPSTASGHLNRLKEIGAVREEREWKKRRYFAGEGLAKVPLHVGTTDAAIAPVAA